MSFKEMERHDFLRLKDLPEKFEVTVHGYRELTTKFGFGRYLIVELIQAPKKKRVKGMLKISDTTGWSISQQCPKELDHLKDLVSYNLSLYYSPKDKTLLCDGVTEWTK